MKRRFNYTGRKRILEKNISIVLQRNDHGAIESFKATINLAQLELPETAKVFVEAYYRTEQKRYDFGTVGGVKSPDDTSLSDLAYTENLRFRVLVVDASGKILASANKVKPVGELEESILPVDYVDLGKQIWRIVYEADEDGPVLQLNRKIPQIETLSHSPEFIFHVYPAVLREVLMHMIFIDTITNQEEPDTLWQEKWLKFSTETLGEAPPKLYKTSPDFDSDIAEAWVNDVVEEFCASKSSDWNEFLEQIMVNSNDKA
jgi:hypothetical protein